MSQKVAIFHTGSATLASMTEITSRVMPETQVMHIIEESMINDVRGSGGVTPQISARIMAYVTAAEKAGCDVFMTACSSVGAVVEACQFATPMRLIRIDQAMAEEAVGLGKNVAVLATVATTLAPTLELIRRTAIEQGKDIEIKETLMPEAFDHLLAGEMDQHDAMVLAGLKAALGVSDVVVLAQASMARVVTLLDEAPTVPVLTSPESGIARLKKVTYEVCSHR